MAEHPKDSVPESSEVARQRYVDAIDEHARRSAQILDVPLDLLAPHLAEFDGFAHAHQEQQ